MAPRAPEHDRKFIRLQSKESKERKESSHPFPSIVSTTAPRVPLAGLVLAFFVLCTHTEDRARSPCLLSLSSFLEGTRSKHPLALLGGK